MACTSNVSTALCVIVMLAGGCSAPLGPDPFDCGGDSDCAADEICVGTYTQGELESASCVTTTTCASPSECGSGEACRFRTTEPGLRAPTHKTCERN